jgi:hypothetical protein
VISKLILNAVLAAGLATSAHAAVMLAPMGDQGVAITRVAEGCGPGFWRGPGGHCHPFARERVCPRGYHLGPEGRRCWPN